MTMKIWVPVALWFCLALRTLSGGCSTWRLVPEKIAAFMWSTELAERPASSRKLEFSWTKE